MKTGQFWVFSVQFSGKREFSQISLLCHFEVLINPQLHAKYQKNLMKQSWEKYKNMSNRAILGLFGPFSGQQEFFQKIRLCHFSVLTNPQLHTKFQKNLMSQYWDKNGRTDGETNEQTMLNERCQNHRTLAKRESKNELMYILFQKINTTTYSFCFILIKNRKL